VTLTGPDGAADRADRPRVAELVLGEAERMQRGDLGLWMSLPSGKLQRAFGQHSGSGCVRLDQLERGLREPQRVVLTDRNGHPGRCIKDLSACSEYS
jgi:hypothetical protein